MKIGRERKLESEWRVLRRLSKIPATHLDPPCSLAIMDPPKPPSMRVLTRPPTPASAALTPPPPPLPQPSQPPPPTTTTSQSQSQPQPRTPDGVVVVGFISRRPEDSAQLINRVVDANAFGSGQLDTVLSVDKEEVRDWFKRRRISYYHEEEKGILYLQFCSTQCPIFENGSGFGSATVEDLEFGDLQGMLFMFTVCHVIIFIQEGSHFDTQILRKFRVLQAAKNALAPFIRSHIMLPLPSRPHSSSSARQSVSASSSKNSSPGRSSGILSRNSSSISLMSGLGSYGSLFPGQCTPVILFVFMDDYSEVPNSSSYVEESPDTSIINQSSNLTNLARPSLPPKGSGPAVVLARPASKSEGGFRKKLQQSLEGQIRFLIKKCRTLSGFESSHAGPRSGGVPSVAPLFSLDASKAVMLLEKSANQRSESLEFVTSLVEDVLSGKATSDSLLLESHSHNANKEDIMSLKEFIFRQSDILRGRGGSVNANSGSAAGVGMVAVAAAAAAASVASGKTFTTPELPNLESWLSSSQLILNGVLSAKGGCIEEIEVRKRKPRQRNTSPTQVEGQPSRGSDPLDIAVSWLESGKGLNTKFSTLWCEKALPTAKEVYLKDLPACYPTLQHEAHLQKALRVFHSMVRGPAVQLFAAKLEDECTSIWRSGRQLCDAVSLTGKPCMHQRHDVETSESLVGATVKPHSSGYVFLQACACGRSRQLRPDPFDFESANGVSNCFLDCDKVLPAVQLPKVSNAGPIKPSSWSLIRVGGARYYEPSKGLLQSGFCPTQKFLLKWTIFLEKQKNSNTIPARDVQQRSASRSMDPNIELSADIDIKKNATTQLHITGIQTDAENPREPQENCNSNGNRIRFGRVLPNFTMRKPFSEVVAGSATTDSGFPPLQQRKQPSSTSEKNTKQIKARDPSTGAVHSTVDQGSQKSESISFVQDSLNGISSTGFTDGNPILQVDSNAVSVNRNGAENVQLNTSLKHVIVYVGFEHECPHGHRFLLNPDHLNELGSLYQSVEESSKTPSGGTSNCNTGGPSKSGKNEGCIKPFQNSARNKVRNVDDSTEMVANGNGHIDGLIQYSMPLRGQNLVKDLEAGLQSVSLDDGGSAFSLLNRNLPLYMNCPHCRLSKVKMDLPNNKFAGTISQLQRIFLVTPPFPVVLATCPVIQFESSCLPPSVPAREQKLQFTLGCQVIIPPDSFLTLRLPFVYGVQLDDGNLHPLSSFEREPELTAWILKGTTLAVMSDGSSLEEGYNT